MTADENNHFALLQKAANGNLEAFKFLSAFHSLVHFVDDIIDEEDLSIVPPTFILAKTIYNCEFYRQNQQALSIVIDLISNAFEDSEEFKKYPIDSWQMKVADIIRSQCIDMTLAVACICGGYTHMRIISPSVRRLSWEHQRK